MKPLDDTMKEINRIQENPHRFHFRVMAIPVALRDKHAPDVLPKAGAFG